MDVFLAGAGTGGTLSGVGEALKARRPGVHIVAVEPRGSAVLSGGKPGPHSLQGIGAGFIPKNLNRAVIDEVIPVADQDALTMMDRLAKEEGILAGISAGAAVAATAALAQRAEYASKLIVTLLPDTAERYLMTFDL